MPGTENKNCNWKSQLSMMEKTGTHLSPAILFLFFFGI